MEQWPGTGTTWPRSSPRSTTSGGLSRWRSHSVIILSSLLSFCHHCYPSHLCNHHNHHDRWRIKEIQIVLVVIACLLPLFLSSASWLSSSSLTGDPATGEHGEGEQERHHRAVLEDQEVRGGGQDRQRRGETSFSTETKYFFFLFVNLRIDNFLCFNTDEIYHRQDFDLRSVKLCHEQLRRLKRSRWGIRESSGGLTWQWSYEETYYEIPRYLIMIMWENICTMRYQGTWPWGMMLGSKR